MLNVIYWIIDSKSLPEYLEEWALEFKNDELKRVTPFMGTTTCMDVWVGLYR